MKQNDEVNHFTFPSEKICLEPSDTFCQGKSGALTGLRRGLAVPFNPKPVSLQDTTKLLQSCSFYVRLVLTCLCPCPSVSVMLLCHRHAAATIVPMATSSLYFPLATLDSTLSE